MLRRDHHPARRFVRHRYRNCTRGLSLTCQRVGFHPTAARHTARRKSRPRPTTTDIYNRLMEYVARNAAGVMVQEVTVEKASFGDGYVATLQDL
jgi:hypothetical protein